MNKNLKTSLILGIMCFFLTLGIAVQINTVSKSTTTVGKTLVENELRDSVLRWKQKYENAYEKLEEKEKTLNSLREQVSNSDETHSGMSSKLARYNSLLGNTEVVGKGIIITVTDGDGSNLNSSWASDYIVHDGDLYEIVNSLKNAGAEAISINGQRITNMTDMMDISGTYILINSSPIKAPYIIDVIGNQEKIESTLNYNNSYITKIKSKGNNVDIYRIRNVKIDEYVQKRDQNKMLTDYLNV